MSQLWKRVTPGRPRRFDSPGELWSMACEYFQWCTDNPLLEEKVWQFQGQIIRDEISKMRAMTYAGLWSYINLPKSTWYNYSERPEYSEVCAQIDDIMREQKFTAAAADLLNPSIIARDLGLIDKQEIVATKPTPDIDEQMSPVEAARLYERTLNPD